MVKSLAAKTRTRRSRRERNSQFREDIKAHLLAHGVVYGDLGTNTLFALKTIFSGKNAIEPQSATVLGVVSLIFSGHS